MHVPNLKMQRILQSHKNTALTLEYPLKTCRSIHLQQITYLYLEISPKSPLPEPLISFLLHQTGNFCACYHVSCHEDLSAVQQLTIFQQYKFASFDRQYHRLKNHPDMSTSCVRSPDPLFLVRSSILGVEQSLASWVGFSSRHMLSERTVILSPLWRQRTVRCRIPLLQCCQGPLHQWGGQAWKLWQTSTKLDGRGVWHHFSSTSFPISDFCVKDNHYQQCSRF